jgi:hypothetical protein
MPQLVLPFGGAPPARSGVGAGMGAVGSKGPTTFAEIGISTANAKDKECNHVILFFFLNPFTSFLSFWLAYLPFCFLLAFIVEFEWISQESMCICLYSLSRSLMTVMYSEQGKKLKRSMIYCLVILHTT